MRPPLPADDARWAEVQRVFHEVVNAPGPGRAAALAAACGNDAALREAVQRLLDADTDSSVLDRPTSEIAGDLLEEPGPGEFVGQRLGPYRLTSKLGEGGSGVVYLAERDDIGSLVAIKVLRDAWVSPSRRDRFLDEQRTLAKLAHPGIGRIFDAGVDHGAPWFAIEYVQGLPLDEHCRRHVPDVIGRIRLLVRVADAVQHAHERLFVHRDLKPSNILVLPDGTPKLLDFGISQHLERLEASRAEAAGPVRFLSPAYAAPEELRGEPSGVQADVYSLGIILTDLVAELRGVDRRAAAADLGHLCATATSVNTATRYATVDALRRDLVAVTVRRPVAAHPPSWLYRLRLWTARHRRSVAAAALLTVLLGAAAGYYSRQLAESRAATEAEAARTDRLLRFVLSLFDGGAGAAPPVDLRVAALLERGVQEARSLVGDPAQAELLQALGGIHQELGDLDRADRLLGEALAARRATPGPGRRDLVDALLAVADLRRVQARFDDASALVVDALASIDAIAPSQPARVRALTTRGRIERDRGDYKASVATLEGVVAGDQAGDAPGLALADALTALSESHFYLGALDAAEASNQRALGIIRRARGDRHPDVGHALLTQAAIASSRQRVPDAERATREALAIFASWYGDAHPETASAKTILAQSLGQQQRYEEGLPLLEQALAVQERVFGRRHPRTAFVQNELGLMAFRMNDLARAAPAFSRAAEGYHDTAATHFQEGVSLANLGSVHLAAGDSEAAERRFRDALRIYAGVLPAEHLNVAVTRSKLGRALVRQRRFGEARPELEAARVVLERQPGAASSWLVATREDLAAVAAGRTGTP